MRIWMSTRSYLLAGKLQKVEGAQTQEEPFSQERRRPGTSDCACHAPGEP